MDDQGFVDLMKRLAEAWGRRDAAAAAQCFTEEAIYMEPPDRQLFIGRDQLTAYFSPLEDGTYLDFHHLWFDETSQVGAAEFSFGVRGRPDADHGAIIVSTRDGLIARWREYQRKGPADFEEFSSTEGKEWAWHIGNYP